MQLRALRQLARAGSYAATEDGQGWSRQQVWQHVHRLEAQVTRGHTSENGVHLARNGRLTPQGKQLLAVAERVLDAVDDLHQAMDSLALGSSNAVLACYPAHAPLAARASDALRAARRPVVVSLTAMSDELRRGGSHQLLRHLREGLADVVVAETAVRPLPPGAQVTVKPLYQWQLLAVVSDDHEFAKAGTIDLADLRGHRLMVSPAHHASRDLLERHGFSEPVWFESESVDALYSLAIGKWGVALLPSDALPVRHGIDQGRHWAPVTHAGAVLGGAYAAIHLADVRPHSPARRLAVALARAASG